ncbi:MAG: endonuclease/exonuclease/phosphatase family protein [Parcubacteria group bacterium]|nr:endonuclease/exonuclease/phosphatase family protein [Parcubacteria group bacterium]
MSNFLSLACVNIEGTKHLDRVLAFLQKEKPDVVCLQEIYEHDLQKFAEELGMESAFGQMVLMGRDNKLEPLFLPFGIALLSRLPMSNLRKSYYHGDEESVRNLMFDGNHQSYYHLVLSAALQKDGKGFTIGTTHFTWTPDGKVDDVQRTHVAGLLKTLQDFPDMVFCGDFNAPRGEEIFAELAKCYKDNIPSHYTTSIDVNLHRLGEKLRGRSLMIDGLFTTPQYEASNVRLQDGVSDHFAILAEIRKL